MQGTLTDFVVRLAEDPGALRAFQDNPQDLMGEAGLSPAEQSLLLTNDPMLIKNAITADTQGIENLAATTFVITAVIVIHHVTEEE